MKKESEAKRSPTAPENDPQNRVRAFIEALQNSPPGEHVHFGMVKAADTADGLLFAHPGDCGRWVYIPASTIADIRPTGRVPCRGHSHPTAEIALKEPQSDLEKSLAGIAGLQSASLDRFLTPAPAGGADGHNCPKGFEWLPDEHGVYSCRKYP